MNARSPGSSVNPHYTFHYAQPAEYRFSHDSVFLARRAFEILRPRLRPNLRLLDLCAGCGIVGLDFMFHLRAECGLEVANADFVEIQDEYRRPFEENRRRGGFGRGEFVRANGADFDRGAYDVVLCNPPFFEVAEGRTPASRFRTRCHFFTDAPWDALARTIARARAPDGAAFWITPRPDRHALPGAVDFGPVRRCRLLGLV